jgi:hypothetical protein
VLKGDFGFMLLLFFLNGERLEVALRIQEKGGGLQEILQVDLKKR